MDFLERLNLLMEKNNLNKSSLSRSCGIPYTTIDGWYKKGYEGLKLTTLRKLSDFFGVTLDYWVSDCSVSPPDSLIEKEILTILEGLTPESQDFILKMAQELLKRQESILPSRKDSSDPD